MSDRSDIVDIAGEKRGETDKAMLIISRRNAAELGARRFFTGRPCKFGHVVERLVSNKGCISCLTRKKMAWAVSNKNILSARKRTLRLNEPERVRSYERNKYQDDPRVKMLSAAKQRAKRKGISFEITVDDIQIPHKCPLLGIPMSVASDIAQDSSPTLDRIRNNSGYVRGNIAVISHAANRCKGALTSDDILKIAKNLRVMERSARERGFI